MPIYEYQCTFCSHKFQLLQKMSDPVPTACPNCHKEGGIKKLISQTSFELKGSGWYVTDYKDSSSSKKEENKDSSNNGSKEENKK